MNTRQDKLQRLVQVARLYYLENRTQHDIAVQMGVSRPLISRMLQEARTLGLVEITIHDPVEQEYDLVSRLQRQFGVKESVLVQDGKDQNQTNGMLSQAIVQLLDQLQAHCVGIGWGHLVGELVSYLEQQPAVHSTVQHICPMVGNAGVPIRNYHSNENVRVLAERLGAAPHFLYLPAFVESHDEKKVLCSTELYHQIEQRWLQMDTALVNIGNYPSTPDFASGARYGDLLQKKHASGRCIAYYFNEAGEIIQSKQDYAIQIPLEILKQCPHVVGLCSANTSPRALRGALHTGLFTHLVAREQLVREIIQN